jgi:hypothetical protein
MIKRLLKATAGLVVINALLMSSVIWAVADQPPKFSMNPSKIGVGRTRVITISVSNGDLSDYSPQPPPESTGITFEKYGDKLFQLANENKSMNITVRAGEDAETGVVQIIIAKADGSDVRSFDLQVTNSLNAGPTPDDMKEVDVTWQVYPLDITKVNFGRRVAYSFYAVEVTIGNNSGFDLQVVGVAFNNSLGVPNVDQYGRPLQIAVDENNNPLTDEHGNKLIRVLNQNGKPLTIDGTPNGPPVYRPLKTYHLATADHRLVRGSIEYEQLYGRRALTLNLITGIGTFVSGFIPFFHALGPKANFSSFSSILNGQLKEGFGIAAPDLTVSQLNRLENVSLRDGLTIPNNRSAKTIVFFPRKVLNLTDAEKKIIDNGSLYPLMDKLGELSIVGKPLIAFKNREIVARRPGEPPATNPAPEPEPRGAVSPARLETNGDLVVTISGSNLLSVTDVKFGALAGTIKEATRTQSTMDVIVPANAQTGDVTISRASGTPNNVGGVHLLPRIVNISAHFAKAGDDITIEGANLADISTVTIGGDPVEIKSKEAGKLVLTILKGTHSGAMVLRLPAALNFPELRSSDQFTMQPVIIDFDPRRGGQGTQVTITGYNFEGLSQVKFGDGVAETIQMNSARTRIAATAPAGSTSGPISVTTVNDLVGKSSDLFTFIAIAVVPEFPTTAVAGQDITITGTNLGDVREIRIGNTAVTTAIKENTPTKITLTIPNGTASGKITITTDGGSISSKDPLTITTPP